MKSLQYKGTLSIEHHVADALAVELAWPAPTSSFHPAAFETHFLAWVDNTLNQALATALYNTETLVDGGTCNFHPDPPIPPDVEAEGDELNFVGGVAGAIAFIRKQRQEYGASASLVPKVGDDPEATIENTKTWELIHPPGPSISEDYKLVKSIMAMGVKRWQADLAKKAKTL